MKVRNISSIELQAALDKINIKYDNNIVFKRFDVLRKGINFTLSVKNSKNPGSRKGIKGNRMASACWHVHGDLFDAILKINDQAIIIAPHNKIDFYGGNWEDYNIGSIMNPFYASEACNCE